jgi:hypothetical protein
MDASGVELTHGYLERTYDKALIEHHVLPGPGEYSIAVLRTGQQNGESVGTYSLQVTLDGAGRDRKELYEPQGAVTLDSIVTGELTSAKWTDEWSLDMVSADRLRLLVTRTDGNLRPRVYLIGANNQEINSGYPDEAGDTASVEVNLPGPGKYTVRVAREDDERGYTTGKYELAVTVLGTAADSELFNTSAGNLTIGEPVTGTLTNAKWKDSWSLGVELAGGPITITVKRTSGTLYPRIRLLGANGQELTSAYPEDTYDTATIDTYNLPGPGKYTVIIYRVDEIYGGTSGGYELTVTQEKSQ